MAMLGKREEPPVVPATPATPNVAPVSPRPAPSHSEAHTILGREAKFSGKLMFEGAVRIDGHFEGEIHTGDHLIIGPSAEVKAKLHVGDVEIHGRVEGDIIAKNSVVIRAPGRLRGNVKTPSLTIEKGVMFDGSCSMGDESTPPSKGKDAS